MLGVGTNRMEPLIECARCFGKGFIRAHTTAGLIDLKCVACNGTKHMTQAQIDAHKQRITYGRCVNRGRLMLLKSTREMAEILGMKPRDLNDIECAKRDATDEEKKKLECLTGETNV